MDLLQLGLQGAEAILVGLLCGLKPLSAVEGGEDSLGCCTFPGFWHGLCANFSNLTAASFLLSLIVCYGWELATSCVADGSSFFILSSLTAIIGFTTSHTLTLLSHKIVLQEF